MFETSLLSLVCAGHANAAAGTKLSSRAINRASNNDRMVLMSQGHLAAGITGRSYECAARSKLQLFMRIVIAI